MKKAIIIILVLLCFVDKAESRISRKEVKAAKCKYIKTHNPIDSLYYQGLRTIRRDQRFYTLKGK